MVIVCILLLVEVLARRALLTQPQTQNPSLNPDPEAATPARSPHATFAGMQQQAPIHPISAAVMSLYESNASS